MKRLLITLIVGLTLALWPVMAEAGQTRVFIRFSIGGAIVVGGGVLFWSLTYSSRISQKNSDPDSLPSLVYSDTKAGEQGARITADPLFHSRPEPLPPLPLEMPFLVFRW